MNLVLHRLVQFQLFERKESFVAVQTLVSRPRKPARTLAPIAPKITPRRLEAHTMPARLQEVEERLLVQAMERHPGRERAITHLLKDIEKPAGMTGAISRLTQPTNTTQIERIEDLLLEAIVRTHPNGGNALDRLLGDVVGDAAIDDTEDEHALADMQFDNDFDGLG
jgi:hypothetical protein